MKREKWEIEVGPITSEKSDEFIDVTYSIRYPRGTFSVIQRVRDSKAGYAEAYARIVRMLGRDALQKETKE